MTEIKFDKTENKAIAYDGDRKIGECCFVEVGEEWDINHTEVSDAYQGEGIGRRMVESVIENSKKYNKTLTAKCSYAKKVLENR